MLSKPRIGILGGMGPEASSDLYKKIIDISQKKYSAVQDTDYPEMLIHSLPLYGFDETGIQNEALVLKQLVSGIQLLNDAKVDFIVIACNTVHHFIDEMRMVSGVPILSIVEETAKKIKKSGFSSVALLASESSYKMKIFERVFHKEKIRMALPTDIQKKQLTSLVLSAMSGNLNSTHKKSITVIMNDIKSQNSEAFVLGCTELPLIITQKDTDMKIFDSLNVLAEASLAYYYDIKEKYEHK